MKPRVAPALTSDLSINHVDIYQSHYRLLIVLLLVLCLSVFLFVWPEISYLVACMTITSATFCQCNHTLIASLVTTLHVYKAAARNKPAYHAQCRNTRNTLNTSSFISQVVLAYDKKPKNNYKAVSWRKLLIVVRNCMVGARALLSESFVPVRPWPMARQRSSMIDCIGCNRHEGTTVPGVRSICRFPSAIKVAPVNLIRKHPPENKPGGPSRNSLQATSSTLCIHFSNQTLDYSSILT
ncbi:unnamed protein product [Periconia digitata]|uniref:Uncharacterized protein n=1 Tax=Periconia digitata TaxID=1303443 RepID=A0A9W4UIS8_9PLEO|nr:unnamed protein product [Periconia digitata]